MLEKVVVSSLLIIAVMIIRKFFQKRLHPVFLYAIWLVVALRLLLPGMVGKSPISVENMALFRAGKEALQREEDRQGRDYKEKQYQEYLNEVRERLAKGQEDTIVENEMPFEGTLAEDQVHNEYGESIMADAGERKSGIASVGGSGQAMAQGKMENSADGGEEAGAAQENYSGEFLLKISGAPTLWGRIRQGAYGIWFVGMAALAVIFIRQNVSLYRQLKKGRRKLMEVNTGSRKITVYQSKGAMASPCLFGLFPAIYIPERELGKERLAFILEHELAHYMHGDQIWGMVRILCLVIHWYNPLVWAAAKLSLRDGEIAADAECLRRLGEAQRIAYGEALLAMVKPYGEKGQIFQYATMMISGKKFMKKRIEFIAEKRKYSRLSMAAVMALTLLCAGCTFTGAGNESVQEREVNTALGVEENMPGQDALALSPASESGQQRGEEGQEGTENNVGAQMEGKALVLKGDMNGQRLEEKLLLFIPEAGDAVSLSADMYLPDLEGDYKKLGDICRSDKEEDILAVLNRNFDLALEEAELWDYETFIQKIDEAGGLTVSIDKAEAEHINNYLLMMQDGETLSEEEKVAAGESRTLNGIQTAAWLQIRYLPSGYRGVMNRWEQAVLAVLRKEGIEGLKIYDGFPFEKDRKVVYVEKENSMLCTDWNGSVKRLHETLFPDRQYEPSAFMEEIDGAIKEKVKEAARNFQSDPANLFYYYGLYVGKDPYMISLFSGAEPVMEIEEARQEVNVITSGVELITDEENGRAVYSMGLIFTYSGETGMPESSDDKHVSVERFLYMIKEEDVWYVDGPLHNNLPPKEWWEGEKIQWETYNFGFSDEDRIGITTSSQEEYDDFRKRAEEAAEKRGQL